MKCGRTYLAYRLRETDGYKLLSDIGVYSSPLLEALRNSEYIPREREIAAVRILVGVQSRRDNTIRELRQFRR